MKALKVLLLHIPSVSIDFLESLLALLRRSSCVQFLIFPFLYSLLSSSGLLFFCHSTHSNRSTANRTCAITDDISATAGPRAVCARSLALKWKRHSTTVGDHLGNQKTSPMIMSHGLSLIHNSDESSSKSTDSFAFNLTPIRYVPVASTLCKWSVHHTHRFLGKVKKKSLRHTRSRSDRSCSCIWEPTEKKERKK